MFEQPKRKGVSPLIKIMPVAVVIFVAIAGVMIYLTQADQDQLPELSGVLHQGDPDYDWYRKYVELTNPKVQMGLNFAGNRMVILSGIVENGGERSLDVVELKVAFFNYEKLISEMTRTPIRPGRYTPPIPPLSKRAFTFYVEKIPKNWGASHAEMSIAGLRFVQSKQAGS